VICIYCDDSWDKKGVKAAFVALVKDIGLVSSAYKCDANTILGISSTHPSKIKSSLYVKNGEFSRLVSLNRAASVAELEPSASTLTNLIAR
jgi:predicted GNAT superfamily acetyltransferase